METSRFSAIPKIQYGIRREGYGNNMFRGEGGVLLSDHIPANTRVTGTYYTKALECASILKKLADVYN